MTLTQIIKDFFQYFYPPYCPYCRMFLADEHDVFCKKCFDMIQPVASYPLKITATCEVSVFSIGAYREPLKQLVLAKHQRNQRSAQDLGHLLWHCSDIKNMSFDYIVPLPLHWSRYAHRWYNQAEEIAHVLSSYSGKPVEHMLRRNKKTIFQTGLSREERKANVENVFECRDSVLKNKEKYKNTSILLIDDVLTTGATITAAVKALRVLHAGNIIVAVGCRVI